MTLGYTLETGLTAVNYTRRLRTVKGITIHHWGSDGASFNSIRNYLAGPNTRSVSAHYVAQGADANGTVSRRVACIVDPDYIAWHAGVWQANVDTIGIECRPEARDVDYEVVAELVRRLRNTYSATLPLYPHKHWIATFCPGRWDVARISRMADALDHLDEPSTPPPTPPEEWSDMATKEEIKAALREVIAEKASSDELFTGHPIVKDTRTGVTDDSLPRVSPSTLMEAAAMPGLTRADVETAVTAALARLNPTR